MPVAIMAVDRSADEGVSLRRLFDPWPVVALDGHIPSRMPPIPVEEADLIAHAVERRRVEFATGRWCARRALADLNSLRPDPSSGTDTFILRNDADRVPQWPVGVVGSLTHTGQVPGGYCAVVVARAEDIRAIGIDAEQADALAPNLWRRVLTATEQAWVNDQESERRGGLAKIIFSAKESFYKAQFPVTRRWLGFNDVDVELDLGGGTFEAHLAPAARSGSSLARASGRYTLDLNLIRTSVIVLR